MELPIATFGLALAIIGTTVVWARYRKFPLVGCLLIVLVIFLFGLPLGFFTLRPGGTIVPSTNFISDTDVSGLTTTISWPGFVVKDQSFDLAVLIGQTPALTASPTAKPAQTEVQSQLTPVGTPNVPIAEAFGPKFDAFAIAELSASAFDIAPQQQAKQSLNQEYVEFDWTLTPRYTNEQTLRVTVTGIWMPKNGGEPIERPLAGHLLHINVSNAQPTEKPEAPPFFVLGQLTLSDLFVALISSALNIPWIVELINKRKETKKKKADADSSARPSLTEEEQKEPKPAPASPPGTQHTPSRRQRKKKATPIKE